MKRRILQPEIAYYLDKIAAAVKLLPSAINDTSFNIYAEPIGIYLYNKIFNVHLKNANTSDPRAKAIDALDKENKIFVQITSDSSFKKVKETVKKFAETEYFKSYELDQFKFQFLILGDKKKLTQGQISTINNILPTVNFTNEDIIDIKDLLKYIYDLDIDQIQNILNYLQKQAGTEVTDPIKNKKFICFATCNDLGQNAEISIRFIKKLIIKGYDVILSSEQLYNYLRPRIRHNNSLWFADSKDDLSMASIAIINASEGYRESNGHKYNCSILKQIVSKKLNHFVFYSERGKYLNNKFPFANEGEKIIDQNFEKRTDQIIRRIEKNLFGTKYEIEDIKKLLQKTQPYGEVTKITSKPEIGYYLYKVEYIHFSRFYMILLGNADFLEIKRQKNAKHKNIKAQNLEILIQKDISQNSIKELKGLFKFDKAHYISDWYNNVFLKNFAKPNHYTDLSKFVDPVITADNAPHDADDVLQWINGRDADLAIIAGSGGIGKTTLCDFLYSKLNEPQDNIVLFINSSDSELLRSFKNKEIQYNLHQIYKKWCLIKGHQENTIIDEDLFIAQLRVGNIVLIFDGLDEIVSTCKDFVLNDFLNSLSNLIGKKQKSKIIISIRDAYINEQDLEANLEINFKIFRIDDFDRERAEKYFDKRFSKHESERKIIESYKKNALKVCEKIIPPYTTETKTNFYPPFFLKIVGDIILHRKNEQSDSDFIQQQSLPINERFFDKDNHIDIILNGILEREKSKKELTGSIGLSVLEQVSILISLALSGSHDFSEEKLFQICERIPRIDAKRAVKRMWDHPLLKYHPKQNRLTFKYNFLPKYFISIGIIDTLKVDTFVSDDLIFNISIELSQNSMVTKWVWEKIHYSQPIELIKNLIERISQKYPNNPELIEEPISNLFLLAISTGSNSIQTRTHILKQIFETSKNKIRNFSLVKIRDENCTFDFRNMVFKNCKIKDYPFFFKCKFNESTYFHANCYIESVFNNNENVDNSAVNFKNFSDRIQGDNSHIEYLKRNKNQDQQKSFTIINSSIILYEILEPLTSLATIDMHEIERRYISRSGGNIKLNLLFNLFIRFEIIYKSKKGIQISDSIRSRMADFQKDRFPIPKEIAQVLNILNKEGIAKEHTST